MKKILITLSVLALGTTTGNLGNFLNTNIQKNNILNNHIEQKTQQDTIYVDENGNQQTTNKKDLSDINSKEIIQIGFYQNDKGQIQAVKMPKTIEKVPNQLPPEITNTKAMFENASSFNQDLSNWNTSNVTDMNHMFSDALLFNGNINNWNTSKVTTMFATFGLANSFNQDISRWNVFNVTNMDSMFEDASSFNQDISNWNVDKVITHINFNKDSGIDNPNKLPKFKN